MLRRKKEGQETETLAVRPLRNRVPAVLFSPMVQYGSSKGSSQKGRLPRLT